MTDYKLTWSGLTGALELHLEADGAVIATGTAETTDEAKDWARAQAAAHEAVVNPPEPSSGEETFTL